MFIQLDDLQIELIRKNIKNINLRVYANGSILLSAPKTSSMDFIHRFLEQKQEWIRKQHRKLQAKSSAIEQEYQSGEVHYFLGETYTLIIHHDQREKGVVLANKYLHCYAPISASKEKRSQILHAWYLEQMQALLPDLIAKWQKHLGVEANRYRIKIMKTLWGSCLPNKKHISLNLNLIKKPLLCLEYVLVHELVHLYEASHNQRFYDLMDKYMPPWRQAKALLQS